MPIDYLEANKSHRATCQRCRKFIEDETRGVKETIRFGHKQKQYFCIPCSGEVIKIAKKELQSMEASLKFHLTNKK